MGNTLITRFNEMAKFTNVKIITNPSSGNRNAVFTGCSNLEELDTVNITSIGGGAGITGTNSAPLYGTKIKEINLPNLTTLGAYGLRTDGTLKKVVVGTKLTSVVGASFANVKNCSILINTTTPPTGSGSPTRNSANSGTYLYVPDDSYDAYYNSSIFVNWKSYIRRMSAYTG